jgi:hypothetical protein
MTLDLCLIEHPQVQHAPPPIGCLKVLINCHWLILKPYVGIQNMFCLTWNLTGFYNRFYRCPKKVAVTFGCGYLMPP